MIFRDPSLWYATIEVDKGSGDGVHKGDPVTGDGALVGEVTQVGSNFSVVSLLTDHTMAVAAQVLDSNGDTGVLVPAVGQPEPARAPGPPAQRAAVQAGQQVTTVGFRSGPLQDLYPAGDPDRHRRVRSATTSPTTVRSRSPPTRTCASSPLSRS